VEVENGVWLQQLLATLHNPAKEEAVPTVPSLFHGTLRPYQMEGFTICTGCEPPFAGVFCLADDMGLGKTPQSLSLLTTIPGKILLVVPPSLVGKLDRRDASFHSTAPADAVGRLLQTGGGAGSGQRMGCT
jgi:hypothetical protein